jgi:hypothetical protein
MISFWQDPISRKKDCMNFYLELILILFLLKRWSVIDSEGGLIFLLFFVLIRAL